MKSSYDVEEIEQGRRPIICHWQSPEQQRIKQLKREGDKLVDRDKDKLSQLIKELKSLGVPHFFWTHPEARELMNIITAGEVIRGVLYGYTESSFAILAATNRQILFIHNQLNKITVNKINYGSVIQVIWENAGLFNLVTLQTETGNCAVRTLNMRSAEKFIDYVETRHAFGLARMFSS